MPESNCPVPLLTSGDSGCITLSSVTVFFPAYNDAPSLPSLLARTFDVLNRCAADYEVVVINDGSTDNTAEVLESLRAEYAPYLKVIAHDVNRGYGGALRTGFANATKEWVFYTDGDGQYDPRELINLAAVAGNPVGLVNGYKMERNDPCHRIAIGWLYNHFARFLFRIRIRDIDCDFRLIRRSALDVANLRSTSGTICVELVRTLELSGMQVIEVPVHHYARQHGRSQFFRVRSLATTFLQLTALFMRLVLAPAITGAYIEKPALRMLYLAGLVVMMTSLACVLLLLSSTVPAVDIR